MGLDTTRCVVLNATYEPITIVSSKRALILFLELRHYSHNEISLFVTSTLVSTAVVTNNNLNRQNS